MRHQRGFAYSIDAFVAFVISLLIIGSLIFFASLPSGYYSTLLQAHYLAKDMLFTLGETRATDIFAGGNPGTALDDAVAKGREDRIREMGDRLIPEQFGYMVQTSADGAQWNTAYTTKDSADQYEKHKKTDDRLMATAETIVFGSGTVPVVEHSCTEDFPCDYPKGEIDMEVSRPLYIRVTVFV
ncbi:MAG: hypothetical protein ACP5NX_03025 [Candidatus Bilamarchaeaceae archaeon]